MALGPVRIWRVVIGAAWLSMASACPGHRKPPADAAEPADAADDRSMPATEVADVPIAFGDSADELIDLAPEDSVSDLVVHPDGNAAELQPDGPTSEMGAEVSDAADAEASRHCNFSSVADFCAVRNQLGCQDVCDCLGTWSAALTNCSSLDGFPYAFENCAGFNIVIISGIEVATIFYYDGNSGQLVGVAWGDSYQSSLRSDRVQPCIAGENPPLSTDSCRRVPARVGCPH